jgi:hypothetical protein
MAVSFASAVRVFRAFRAFRAAPELDVGLELAAFIGFALEAALRKTGSEMSAAAWVLAAATSRWRSWQFLQGELAGPQRGQVSGEPGVPGGGRQRGESPGRGIDRPARPRKLLPSWQRPRKQHLHGLRGERYVGAQQGCW